MLPDQAVDEAAEGQSVISGPFHRGGMGTGAMGTSRSKREEEEELKGQTLDWIGLEEGGRPRKFP